MSDIGYLLEAQLPGLQRYACSLTRDRTRAEDLVQNCLVRALSRQHQWHQGTNLRAWLFTILHNEHVSQVRRRTREKDWLPTADIEPAAMPNSDPEMSYCVHEVQNAMARLPIRQREILVRIGLSREEYGDTAASLGIPVGTVRSRLARARERLRALTDRPPPAVPATARHRAAAEA